MKLSPLSSKLTLFPALGCWGWDSAKHISVFPTAPCEVWSGEKGHTPSCFACYFLSGHHHNGSSLWQMQLVLISSLFPHSRNQTVIELPRSYSTSCLATPPRELEPGIMRHLFWDPKASVPATQSSLPISKSLGPNNPNLFLLPYQHYKCFLQLLPLCYPRIPFCFSSQFSNTFLTYFLY